jgi:hypothetical protein
MKINLLMLILSLLLIKLKFINSSNMYYNRKYAIKNNVFNSNKNQYSNKEGVIDNQSNNNNNNKNESKFYLKDFLNNDLNVNKELTKNLSIENIEPINTCKLKQIEISLLIKDCGRITINSTSCSGLCKSNEKILANTNLKKSTCSACKAVKHTSKTYRIKCSDKSYKIHKFKQIKECSCFKLIDRIRPT